MHSLRVFLFPCIAIVLAGIAVAAAEVSSHEPIALGLDGLEIVNRAATMSGAEVHLSAAPGAGLAWIKGLELNEGCLALEVKGSNEFGRSFVGVAFRGVDQDTYDTVYVRPFVFQSDNPDYVSNGLQYMSMPDFAWPVLRERFPKVYEKPIGSRPSPDDWVQLVVRFGSDRVQVFVNGSATAQLDVATLSQQAGGRVALWVGNNSSGAFRSLRRCVRTL
jgi:hypothetical protein